MPKNLFLPGILMMTAEDVSGKKIRYTYDSEGKLIKLTYPTTRDGVQGLTYEYNSNGWLMKIAAIIKAGENNTAKTVRSYTYDSFDRVKEMVYTDFEHPDTVMESFAYEYDKNSNITKKKEMNHYPSKDQEKINETKMKHKIEKISSNKSKFFRME